MIVSNSWLCKTVIIEFDIFLYIYLKALTITDISRCVSMYGGFSLTFERVRHTISTIELLLKSIQESFGALYNVLCCYV